MRRARIFIPCICGILFSITNGLAQELYTHSNATNIGDENNSTTGWTAYGVTTVTTISETDGSSNHSIVVTGNSGTGFNAARTTITGLTNGAQYNVVIRARNDAGNTSNGSFFAWFGIQESINTSVISNVYQDYTFTVTSDGNDFVITSYATLDSGLNNKIYISSVSVQPVNQQGSILYTEPSAASKTNESAEIGASWSNDYWLTVESADVYAGNYALKVGGKNAGAYELSGLTISSIPGETYTIEGYVKVNTINTQGMDFIHFTNISVDIGTSPTTSYAPFKFTGEATGSTFILQVYGSSGTPTTDYLLLDELSIYQGTVNTSDTQPPTAPTLSSTGQSDITADLSWSGATDNVGVTGYKIFKDSALEATLGNVITYQATGLTADTVYNFTVTALDAAGNESVVSNAVSVTTNGSGGGSSGGGSSVWSEASSVASYTGDVAVGTGTVPTGYKMAIDGKLITEEVKVQLSGNWPDYVFAKNYNLPSLEEVQKHIKEKGHLPNIPSARETEANGIDIGEMNRLLLEKIEEQMLYIIELKKEINQLKRESNEKIKKIEAKVINKENKS
ncbi:hypothetical protein FVB32_16415 [Flagellimonas hymeniacidonis]|uniref:Fibronectin type-III domain-containing protein n=1 Tax=Flagellimonas hymeniacidonis TaxID=2603628 RepID=A0A5C8V458_9FLAO|nr:hypothetical protein [Flagellimonas hymeniacidonis]TXN36141.1 hypothetical protein FVB32_16415 [Flagellimonas hymeniacidonis]